MDRKFEAICPECGHTIQITLSEAGIISVSFFNAYNEEEAAQIAKEMGYEFGKKGGADG